MYAELDVDQGCTFSSSIELKTDDGSAINVANAVFSAELRKSFYSSSNVSITVTTIDAPNGNIQMSLTSAQTSNIKPGRYVYDLKMLSDNTTVRVLDGVITVSPQVSGGQPSSSNAVP